MEEENANEYWTLDELVDMTDKVQGEEVEYRVS